MFIMSDEEAFLFSSFIFKKTSSLYMAIFFGALIPNFMLILLISTIDICIFSPIIMLSSNFLVSISKNHLPGYL